MPLRRALSLIIGGALGLATTQATSAQPEPALSVVERWPGPDGGWDYSAFDPAHRRLYIGRTDGITAVDVDTGKVTARLLTASRTHIALPINGGAEILVTEGGTGSALIADATTGKVRTTIKTGKKPDAALLEPVTGLALVMDNAGGGIALIDPRQGSAVGHIVVDGDLEFGAADGAGKVFVNVENKNEIVVIDIKRRKVVGHYKLDGCEAPSGLAYVPQARALISACSNGVAKVVAADDGKILSTLTIGLRPDATLYDPQRKLAYIPTGQDGLVYVIAAGDAKHIEIVAKGPGQVGTRSGALDPKTGRLFLPSAMFAPATTPGGRPVATPGTFQVLVLAKK
jgi:hypothetical protein